MVNTMLGLAQTIKQQSIHTSRVVRDDIAVRLQQLGPAAPTCSTGVGKHGSGSSRCRRLAAKRERQTKTAGEDHSIC